MRILLSWLAFNNDFLKGGKVDKENSPNYTFHEYFFKGYDKHIILSQEKEDNTRLNYLLNAIHTDFPKHMVEARYMNVQDVINLNLIKTKVESLLLELKEHELDIYFSPGTSVMQVAWYICHSTLGLKTRILQVRPAQYTKDKKVPELLEMQVEKSSTPFTAVLKEAQLEGRKEELNYKITRSLKPVYEKARLIASTDRVTVLIRGDSGTGKEHLARYIHEHSTRKQEIYEAVNCSAFPDNLLHSHLFGHVKGAFTDANAARSGLFKYCHGGSIFLDEIGDISPLMQQSLLRVIQTREFQPLGSDKTQKTDVRIITATHRDLETLCKEEKFRWDLYYRLNVVELELPSLAERGREETEELVEFFLKQKAKELGKKALVLSAEARKWLLSYPWPGNVRELENVIYSLYVFCNTRVELSDIPKRKLSTDNASSFLWKDAEKAHIQRVLNQFKGRQLEACKAMGYGSYNTLKKKMKEYGIGA